MRCLTAILIVLGSVMLTGCDSIEPIPSWQDRFAPEPQMQVFAGDQQTVFNAARAALDQIDFTVTRARMNQGVLEAHSGLHAGDTFGRAQQYTMSIKIRPADEPGKTEVAVRLRQQEESSSFAGATDRPIAHHGLYDSFFSALKESLSAPSEAKGKQK